MIYDFLAWLHEHWMVAAVVGLTAFYVLIPHLSRAMYDAFDEMDEWRD